ATPPAVLYTTDSRIPFRSGDRPMRRFATAALLLLTATPAFAQDMPLSQVLIDGEGWRLVAEGFTGLRGLAVDGQGNVFVSDPGGKELVQLRSGGKLQTAADVKGLHSLAFGADG